MSLVALVGFEHLTAGTIPNSTIRLLQSLSVPRFQADVDLFQSMSTAAYAVTAYADTRGVTRKYLMGGPSGVFNFYPRNNVGTTPARTGKWILGARVKLNGSYGSTPVQLFNCRFGSTTLAAQPSNANVANGTWYIEIEVNWATNSLIYYVNGEVVYTVTNDATRIDPTYASWYIQMGGIVVGASGSSWGITDMYFVVDVPGEANPVGTRLGQIKVQKLPIDAVANSSKFATQSGTGTIIDVLNTPVPITGTAVTQSTDGILTDPRGSLMELSYAAPTITETIKGVHVYEIGYRDATAAVGMISNIQQGAVINSKSLIPSTNTSLQSMIDWPMTLDLNGEAWTPAKIAQLKVHVGSYRP